MILYVLIGVPGSGKSTWAKKMCDECGAYWVSRDKIRFSYLKEDDDYFAYEEQVINDFVAEIQNAIYDRFPTIIADATHLTYKSRNQLLSQIYLQGYAVVYVYFNTSLETALERNAQRSGRARVPDSVIERMYNSLTVPTHHITVYEDGEEEMV